MRTPAAALCLLTALVSTLSAQRDLERRGKDLRDVLKLKNGRELDGRLRTPFATDELLMVQGGRRQRVDRADVVGVDRVHDRLATFGARFATAAANPRMLWMVAEWAATAELPEMAELAAWRVLDLEADHEAAHELLGHRQHPTLGWLYRDRSQWLPLDRRDERHADWGKALEVRSENFLVRSNAGHAAAVDALLDLERLYIWLFAEYGHPLQLVESLQPMVLHVHASAEDFPKWGFEPVPYFVPPGQGDHGATWLAGPRPARLFEIGTQLILSRCLGQDQTRIDAMQRACATAELGFAQYVEGRFGGPPGLAVASPVRPDAAAAELARNARRYDLPNLLHLDLRAHFYGALLTRRGTGIIGPGGALGTPLQLRESTNVYWASAAQFITFLLDPVDGPGRPAATLEWLRLAVGENRGDSSSTFDETFGHKIEDFEEPFREWLVAQGAAPLPRRR